MRDSPSPDREARDFHAASARLYREVWGRAVAALTRQLGDLNLAEDVLQEAWLIALERWRRDGFPNDPIAWLLTTARNKARDRIRRATTLKSKEPLLVSPEFEEAPDPYASSLADDRLRLMFTCCHPALASDARVALTLRTISGLTTAEIARAFLVGEATMGQRLARAKKKIRVAGIPYEVPTDHKLPERLGAILAVIYLVFTEGYAASAGDDLVRVDLCEEAIRLARVLADLMPDEAEVHGLLALLLLHHSRRSARVDSVGDIVLLENQDRSRWDANAIADGLRLVERALRMGPPGLYVLQAAIAANHAAAPSFGATDWREIASLYDLLVETSRTPVVLLNRAVALAMRDGPETGLDLIDGLLADPRLARLHLTHAARADLLRRLGRRDEAVTAYEQALALDQSAPERRYLQKRLVEVKRLK